MGPDRRVSGRPRGCALSIAGPCAIMGGRQIEEGVRVPLSEDEQRILTEIEQHLYASDPGLARQVGSTTVYTAALRGVRLGIVGLVGGLVLAIVLLQLNFVASFVVGFGLMLVSAWHLQRSLRRLGRTGLDQVGSALHVNGLRDYLNNAGERARDMLRGGRDDEE